MAELVSNGRADGLATSAHGASTRAWSCAGRRPYVVLFILWMLAVVAACNSDRRWASEPCSGDGPCAEGGKCIEGFCAQPCSGNGDCDQGVCLKAHCTSAQYACAHGLCDDGNACSVDGCDSKTGKCTPELLAGPCSDGDLCTVGDECVEAGAGPQCKAAAKCDDGDPATTESCDAKTGQCSNLP